VVGVVLVYEGSISAFRAEGAGVPQGSVISTTLFNHLVAGYPHTSQTISSYDDDFTVLTSAVSPYEEASQLTDHASEVAYWADRKGLSISIPKTNAILFTLDTHRSQLNLAKQLGRRYSLGCLEVQGAGGHS